MILLNFITIVLSCQTIFYCLSCIEKRFLQSNISYDYEMLDNTSLLWFKRLRLFNSILGGIEIVAAGKPDILFIIVGVILIFIGTYFRIEAIRSLGKFWSFNIVRYEDQPVVTTGIYKYLSHPSYIGNIANIGVYILFGAILSATLATGWLSIFASYRIFLERRYALCR